ncbi:MAG TPA: hypothetical protein H9987_10360 [Candidatus Luteococcus avicola]|nr:hypothetical protein [Candidatus Luteococcus avicola]
MTTEPRRASQMDGLAVVTGLFLLTRALFALVAAVVMRTSGRSLHDVISAWDVQHFEAIALHGYAEKIDQAFFPGLPMLLRVGVWFDLPLGGLGVVIGLVTSWLAAVALYRMGGWLAAAWWLAAPTSVFTTVAYTEGPFCAAAFWAWERARSRDWTSAALLGLLACSFRISGLFLVGALGLLALAQTWTDHRRGELDARRSLAGVGLAVVPALAIVGYFAHLHQLTGSWRAWLDAQQTGWARGFTSPLGALRNTLDSARPSAWPDRPRVAQVFALEVISMLVGTATSVACLARRRIPEAGWVGIQVVAFATSYWFMSVNRAVLLWFPLYLLLGQASTWRPRSAANLLVWRGVMGLVWLGSLAASLWWAWLLYTGQWAS